MKYNQICLHVCVFCTRIDLPHLVILIVRQHKTLGGALLFTGQAEKKKGLKRIMSLRVRSRISPRQKVRIYPKQKNTIRPSR